MKLWRYGHPIETIGQRYRLEGMLGSGGMAEVCLAWDEREQREVAIKILKSDDLDQETLNRFMKEAGQIVGWQHPHILRVYENMQIELVDAVQGSVLFYIVMEYARGGDLHKRLTSGKAFPLSASFELFHQLCSAVQYAHEHGVIHRDLKPLNILFRRPANGPEEVVLSDFGLAVQVDASHHTFARGGTLAYMAPEQFQGHAMPASDLFALGIILYQLCTGHLPFRRSIHDFQRTDEPPMPTRPSLFNPDLPPALDEPILRALNELPTERYRSAQEFWQTLETTLTTSAQTYPFFANSRSKGMIETWPIADREHKPQTNLPGQSATPGSLPIEPATTMEEGIEPIPGSIREKQKAPPGLFPGLSLPTYSIPGQPKSARPAASETDKRQSPAPRRQPPIPAPRTNQPIDDETWSANATHDLFFTADETEEIEPQEPQPGTTFAGPPSTLRASRALNQWRVDPTSSRTGEDTHTSRRRFDLSPQGEQSQYGSRTLDPAIIAFPQEEISHKRRPTPAHGTRSIPNLLASGSRASVTRPPLDEPSSSPSRRQPALPAFQLKRRHTGQRLKLPVVPILATLVLLILVAAIFAAGNAQGWLTHAFNAPAVTVTLTPRSQVEQNAYTLTALPTGTPDPAQLQIPARLLTATSPVQSATGNATGAIPGKKATGQLTFINNTANTITVQSAILTGKDGVQITFMGPVTVPANPPTTIVPGVAINFGASGNIPTLDISEACCAPNNEIFVKNTAFTGGQDAAPGSVIQQQDINNTAQPLINQLTQNAQESLKGQVKSNERVVTSSLKCLPTITANHAAGDQVKTFTVSIVVSCTQPVYDYQAAQRLAANLLQIQASSDPHAGPNFIPSGQITLSITDATADAKNSITINLQAQGLWVYAFSAARLNELATLIAGKTQAQARSLLLQQAGIVSLGFSGTEDLPGNPAEIKVVVKNPTS